MRIFAEVKSKNWDQTLDAAAFAHNTTPRTDIGVSPFYCFYGRDALLIEDLATLPPIMHDPSAQQVLKQTRDMIRRVSDARNILAVALRELRRKQRSDRGAPLPRLKSGDIVLVRNHKQANSLSMPFYGPYKILRRVNKTPKYEIKHLFTNREGIAHARHLRLYPDYCAGKGKSEADFFNKDGTPKLPADVTQERRHAPDAKTPTTPPIPPTISVPNDEPEEPGPEENTKDQATTVPTRSVQQETLINTITEGDMILYKIDDTHAKIAQVLDKITEEERFQIHIWHHGDDPNILSGTWSMLNWRPLWHTPDGPKRSTTMPAKYDEAQRITSTVAYDDIISRFHKNEMQRGRLPTHIVTILRRIKARHTAY